MEPAFTEPVYYYDGVHADRKLVHLSLESEHLWIRGDAVDERWPYLSLRRVDDYGMHHLRLCSTSKPHARLTIADPELIRKVSVTLPPRVGGVRARAKPVSLVVWLLGAVATLGALFVLAPHFARPIVAVMPRSWDNALGAAFVDRLLDDDTRIGDREILGVVRRLLQRITSKNRVHAKVYLAREPYLNAIALPGGHIIVYCGLIEDLKSGDELAGILGHEIAHVQARHSTEALVRVLGVSVVFGALVGDFGGVAGGAAETLDALISSVTLL